MKTLVEVGWTPDAAKKVEEFFGPGALDDIGYDLAQDTLSICPVTAPGMATVQRLSNENDEGVTLVVVLQRFPVKLIIGLAGEKGFRQFLD